jgi:hypothetical protein
LARNVALSYRLPWARLTASMIASYDPIGVEGGTMSDTLYWSVAPGGMDGVAKGKPCGPEPASMYPVHPAGRVGVS